MTKKQRKKISFVATGTEIVNGDIYERNMHDFSKEITERGGLIFQHIATTDNTSEIVEALRYLLVKSDVIIITGGLGPTSDDRTRFALAEVLNEELVLKEEAWNYLVERLRAFQLLVRSNHQQQALFPEKSTLIPNKYGSAYGCYIEKNGKLLFMLPGPPRENKSMFMDVVLPKLAESDCFSARKIYRWLTLGLIEGIVAEEIDNIISKHMSSSLLVQGKSESTISNRIVSDIHSGFRWSYPYLEIKIINDGINKIDLLLNEIDAKLAPYLVSQDEKLACDILKNNLVNLSSAIYVVDEVTKGQLSKELAAAASSIIFIENSDQINQLTSEPILKICAQRFNVHQEDAFEGTITFTAQGFSDSNTLILDNTVTVPYRGKEILEFAKAYAEWQLGRFVNCISKK